MSKIVQYQKEIEAYQTNIRSQSAAPATEAAVTAADQETDHRERGDQRTTEPEDQGTSRPGHQGTIQPGTRFSRCLDQKSPYCSAVAI